MALMDWELVGRSGLARGFNAGRLVDQEGQKTQVKRKQTEIEDKI
jgi:hypothetical protein